MHVTELVGKKTSIGDQHTDLFSMRSVLSFYLCYLLCLSLGLACIMCVCFWNTHWRGGFAWDGSSLQFNWHPVLMVTGLVVLYGNGAVVYRIPLTWGYSKLPWKILHAGMMLLAVVLAGVGLYAVFDNHNRNGIRNIYSLHSWIGICTVALFSTQWLLGLAGFLLPFSPLTFRKALKPVHVWMGAGIVSLSIASCISGINEKLFFALKHVNGSKSYDVLPPEALFGNTLGVLIIAFGAVVLIILANHRWRRNDPSDENVAYSPLHQEDS